MAKKTMLIGAAGTGKTTRAVAHMKQLLADGVSPYNMLVLLPQRTLSAPFETALRDVSLAVPGDVDMFTLDGLALRTIKLTWPQIAARAGFKRPTRQPTFLTIETAQYYMAQVIEPLLAEGYFDPNVVSVTITLPRLMSQLLDNLEKAALIGLPHTQVGARLKTALGSEISSRVAFDHVQVCINAFREYCLRQNLLDFSLRMETFRNFIWADPALRRLLTHRYRHLIVDNVEEHNPLTHRVLADWLPEAESAFLVFDEDAGYRIFLGANWRTGLELQQLCDTVEHTAESFVAPADVLALGEQLAAGATGQSPPPPATDPRTAFTFRQTRFYPQSLDAVVDEIARLVNDEGVSPAEIVVLAPFVSDALRFSFLYQMAQRGLPARSHRPSRALNEEPAALTILTLARLIHPEWEMPPDPFDVMQALTQSIAGLDLVRARLLVDVLYRPHSTEMPLFPFEEIEGGVRERITYQIGQKFDRLREWLLAERDLPAMPLDHTFSRLFGEILSQPGYGFYQSLEAGEVVANLIESIRKFRRVTGAVPVPRKKSATETAEILPDADFLNRAYVNLVEQGVVAALYTRSWEPTPAEAVLIAPAYTYLMSNRPVAYQFWLDAGSNGWWERIAQPLTHPFVLSADWDGERTWSDADEVAAQNDRLRRLVLGLTRRCKKHIYIVNAEINERGYEQRGRLLLALHQTLRRLPTFNEQ